MVLIFYPDRRYILSAFITLSGLKWVGKEGVGDKKLPVVYFLQLLRFLEASKTEPPEAFNIQAIALYPWPLQVQDHLIR